MKFYGDGESNRIKRLNGDLPGGVGTNDFNFHIPENDAEREFWGYPTLFRRTENAIVRAVSVRFRVGTRTEVISGGTKPPRVFLRLRATEADAPRSITEARFRALSTPAMRALYKDIDVPPNTLLVVERGEDVDFEARAVLPIDAEYASLVLPGEDLRQQIYMSS